MAQGSDDQQFLGSEQISVTQHSILAACLMSGPTGIAPAQLHTNASFASHPKIWVHVV